MSLSPNSSLVRRTIDLNYDNKQRSGSLKWIFINATLFLLFTYDLCCACPGYIGALHYVEACLCAVLCGNVLSHALRLMPRRSVPPVDLSRQQQRLLGLRDEDLDSSFHITPDSPLHSERAPSEPSGDPLVMSLSPPRSWRGGGSPPHGGGSPARSPPSPPSPSSPAAQRDQFISDPATLERYLRERSRVDTDGAAWPTSPGGAWALCAPAPAYRVSPLQPAGAGADAAEERGASPGGGAQVWRRLHLDPHDVSQFDLNLRRWLHETILERLVREMDACDAALAAAGQEARVGGASPARLAAVAAAAAPPLAARLRALLPFLRPFADQQYVCERVRELARSSCLLAYRWDGGGPAWEAPRPTDAELVLHLFAAYLDSVVPGGGGAEAGAFSARHLSAAPAAAPRGPRALVLHRTERSPPHYVLVLGEETVEVDRGRNNLLHSLVLFVAAVARRDPPALLRLHLGPAGLNLLWVLGR